MNSKSYFNHVAGAWDTMRLGFFSVRIRDVAIGVAEIRSGELAADIGAGTGFMTQALVAKGAKVIAVDQSEKMLEELDRKYAATGAVDSRLGVSENLPIADQQVDKAFANMYLHHVEYPDRAILEIKRILKPGGRLVITDLEKHDFEFLRKEHFDRWTGFYRSEIRHWLARAGFSNIIVSTLPEEKCCTSSRVLNINATIDIFLATGTA